MKLLITICLSFLSFSTFASCPDFSGKYLDTGMEVEYSFTQIGCDTVGLQTHASLPWNFSDLNTDGKDVLVKQMEEGSISVSASFVNNDLVLTYTFVETGTPGEKQVFQFVCKKQDNGNVEIIMSRDGEILTGGIFEKL